MSFVKRGNLKRSKLATGRPVNETNYIGGGIGEGTPMEKDSTSNIANATHAQGNIETLINYVSYVNTQNVSSNTIIYYILTYRFQGNPRKQG